MKVESEKKPRGAEGGTIQISNLDAHTVEKLAEIKKAFCVGTNSKAAVMAIKNYMSQRNENQSLRLQLQQARETIQKQQQIITQIEGITRNYRIDNNEYQNI
jgi:hypothetical protein